MRFLPSSPARAAAEILLTVAIVAFVVYDLSGRSSAKPEASNVALSFEAKRPSAPAASSSRFDAAVSSAIGLENQFRVCGNTLAPANPWVIGNGTINQALVVQLSSGCSSNPAILNFNAATNQTTVNGITVNSGSWLSFQAIQVTGNGGLAGATSGPLIMNPGSYLETIASPNLIPIDSTTVLYPLLLSTGSCPAFTGVNILPTTNCPAITYSTGSFSCGVVATNVVINAAPYCSMYLAIVGALSKSSAEITMQISKDCSTFTVDMFKQAIFLATGVSKEAISVKSWACGSITIVFVVLGSDPALIAQAVQLILASARPGGILYAQLGVTYVGLGPVPTSYYPLPYCFYNGQSYCGTTSLRPISSSNPALFALLTLLVIPVALILGIFVWCCLQKEPVCAPLPVCTPAPACYFPEPVCPMPCDPCAAAAPLPMMTPAPYCQ